MSEEVKIYGTLVKGTVNKKLAYTDELFDKKYGNPPTEEDQKSQEYINLKIKDIEADYLKSAAIGGLINNASYSNNTLTFTFQDKTKPEIELNLSDLAIDGMLADVLYLKKNDTKPADFPQDYSDGYPCYYFQWNIQEVVELVIEGVTTEVIQTSKKVIVVPTNDFIDINFNYKDNNKNYAVKKTTDGNNNLYVNVPWTTYNAGSNITITDNNISSVVPKKELSIDGEGVAEVLDGTYYTYNYPINALTIKFPYISDTDNNAHGLAILFTSGNAPSISYKKADNSDYTPKKTIGFLIESNTTYEMTCTYVNNNWYISAIPFET